MQNSNKASIRTNGAQGAIEYLLIIGAAIIVVAIVILALTGVLQQGQSQEDTALTRQTQVIDEFKETSGKYYRIGGNYYMKSNSNDITSNLVGLWHLDENSVPTATNVYKDSSGKGHDAICYKTPYGPCPSLVPGLDGGGQKLVGTAGWAETLEINPKIDLGTEHTLSIWVNFTEALSNTVRPVFFADSQNNQLYTTLSTITDTNPDIYVGYIYQITALDNNTWSKNKKITTPLPNRWYNIVLVRKGDDLNYFINGIKYSVPVILKPNQTAMPSFSLQQMGNAARQVDPYPPNEGSTVRYFENAPKAIIDEIAVWDVALSEADVNKLFFGN